jgi:hypothetical protein
MLLKAGAVTVLYEKGFLRYISYGGSEILRMIYFAWRDENWVTIDAVIKNERITVNDNHFDIKYDCYHQINAEEIFYWKVTISGDEKGEIIFEIDGNALKPFQKNRLGFCVLHPISGAAGQPVEITHPDGSRSEARFPEYIAANSPFKDIINFKWQKDSAWYRLGFEGDIFETEDQRNWTDASFKTFCTPHDLPVPVAINKGDHVYQRIVFSPETALQNLLTGEDKRIHIIIQDKVFTLPEIGIGASTETTELPASSATLLRSLSLNHYCIDVDPGKEDWVPVFFRENEHAKALQLPLQIALHLGVDFKSEIAGFITISLQTNAVIKAIVLLSKKQLVTDQQLIDHIQEIHGQLPGVLIGVGTDFNFMEINHNRFNTAGSQFVSYAIHPQEHASDDLSIVENIAAQAETVKSAKNIYDRNMPVFISPVTLKKRFNPYANDSASVIKTNKERNDSRQKTSFCALFTLGSIKNLTMAEATCVTFFQTIGDQGVISGQGDIYPVYEALQLVMGKSSKKIIVTQSGNPLIIDSLLFADNTLLLWNYTLEDQIALLPDLSEIKLSPRQIITVNYSG